MADRELRLRVGASIDSSFTQVMSTVVDQAKRARKQIASEMKAGAKESAKADTEAAAVGVAAIKTKAKAVKSVKDQMAAWDMEDLRKAKSKGAQEVAIHKAMLAEMARDDRAAARERNARAAADAKAESANNRKGTPRDLSRGGALMMRSGAAALGMGARMVGSVLSGLGVDTSTHNQLHSSVEREQLAIDIASQGYIGSGKGPKGSKNYVNPDDILTQANQVGTATGTDTKDVLGGVERFVKMTGDLQTARDSMAELGKIAKANGADMGDMMEAAANVSIAMGDIENKGPALASIMRTVAGQGHLGAVAIKDMAAQMGKLTGQANFFKIDPRSAATLAGAGVSDPVAQRVAVMGAMAQYARAKGGRITAGQATQSSMAFIRDLAAPTEVKRLAAMGISTYTDSSHTMVRDPLQMMLAVAKHAQAAGGLDRNVINKAFPLHQSRAVGNALMQDYNAKYREAAEQGITDETKRHQFAMEGLTESFQNYLRVTQSGAETQMKFDAAMKGTKSQATLANIELGKVVAQITIGLLPALKALTPAFSWLADKIADMTGHKDEMAMKDAVTAHGTGINAMALAERIAGDAGMQPGKVFISPMHGLVRGPETPGHATMSAAEGKEIEDAHVLLSKAIAEKQKLVDKSGGLHSGDADTPTYASRGIAASDALATKGDMMAQTYVQNARGLAMLQDDYKRLTEALLTIANGVRVGSVTTPQKVEIVADQTTPPPGATPKTSGTADPNSSH